MKSKMKKKLIAFMLCMVLVICNSVSILADTPAPETKTTQQVKETKTVKEEKASEESKTAAKDSGTSEQSEEEKTPEVKTTEKKEATTKATTESTKATTETAEETTTEAKEDKTEATTEAAEETTTEEKRFETSATSEETTEASKAEEKTTEVKEETDAVTELKYEDEEVVITVSQVAEGAIPEGVELKVVPILKDDIETKDQYLEVEKQIQEKAAETETEIKGFLAYDISFVDKDGNEIEPNSEVKVSMEYRQAAIPEEITAEDAKNAEVSVMHLEEDVDGNVAEVVDMGKAGKIDTLETTDDNKVEKVEVKTENFSNFVAVWSVENLSLTTSGQTSNLSDNGNSLFDSIAEDYQPEGNLTNKWQIVSGEYNFGNGHGDGEYTITKDGMFRLQKKVIPTGTENEFYIYLNMEPVMSWEEVFVQSTIWLCNSNSNTEIVTLEGGPEEDTATAMLEFAKKYLTGGSNIGRLVGEGEKCTAYPKNNSFHNADKVNPVNNIALSSGGNVIKTIPVEEMAFSLTGTPGDSFTIIFKSPASNKYIKTSVSYNASTDTLTIPAEAWGYTTSGEGTGDFSLLNGNVTPSSVTDTMGDCIQFLNVVKCTNGEAKCSNGELTWNNFKSLEKSEDANDYVVYNNNYYRKNAYQLVYKIRLNVTDDNFKSCAEELFDGVKSDESVHYKTNASTKINYDVKVSENTTDNREGDFTSPVVRGLLYDIEFQKVDGASNPLKGAVFKLSGENEYSEESSSDEEGHVKFRNLPCGTYKLEEITAPTGYINSYEKQELVLCYTTNPDNFIQDHGEPHKIDDDKDVKNALYRTELIGESGKIINQSESIDPGPGPSNPTTIPNNKQIDWLGDDDKNPDTKLSGDYYYRLYLDATGIPDTEPEGADIVFVLDMSSSMRFDMEGNGDSDNGEETVPEETWRLNYVKDAATQAIETIQESCKKQGVSNINIGLVTFNYGNAKHKVDGSSKYEMGTKILCNFTNNYDSLLTTISNLGTSDLNNRTNYEAAFAATDELLKSSKENNKYVVFITDGETNGYTEDGIGFEGNGNKAVGTEKYTDPNKEGGNKESLIQAQSIASKWTELEGFYTIAVSEDIQSEVLKTLGPSGVTRLDLQANDQEAISEAFSTVVSAITKQVCDVTITDQLSEYVEFVNEAGETFAEQNILGNPEATNIALKVTKTLGDSSVELEENMYTVSIDKDTKTISVNFGDDYFLEPEATYTISFNVKLTNKAFEDQMNDRGEQGTDYGTNNTSVGEIGHFSNLKAKVTYSTVTDGKLTEYSENYNKPVVQKQESAKWKLFKKSDTKESDLYLSGAKFQLLQNEQVKYTGESIVDDINTEGNELGYIQWKDTNGNIIDEKDIEAGSYVLKEIKAPIGYSLSNYSWKVKVKYMEAPEICTISSNGSEGEKLIYQEEDGVYKFIITNTALYELPSAGGPGIYWYTLSGALLMMGAALIVYKQQRKREVLLKK